MGTNMVGKILSSLRECSISKLRTCLAGSSLFTVRAHSEISQGSSVDVTRLQERTCGQEA